MLRHRGERGGVISPKSYSAERNASVASGRSSGGDRFREECRTKTGNRLLIRQRRRQVGDVSQFSAHLGLPTCCSGVIWRDGETFCARDGMLWRLAPVGRFGWRHVNISCMSCVAVMARIYGNCGL